MVKRRRWCSEEAYAETVALAQSLPGPASSQVAFALGLYRAGIPGALAAWAGFTLPSALLLFAFACGRAWPAGRFGAGALHGLQLVAVAIVAQAVLMMRRSLAPDIPRITLALVASGLTLFFPSGITPAGIIALSALLGLVLDESRLPVKPSVQSEGQQQLSSVTRCVTAHQGVIATGMFVLPLILLPLVAPLLHGSAASQDLSIFRAFYRSGSLVFGGGHVVLPLLEGAVVAPGWVEEPTFLAGYGAAQAVPGPLFSFAAYLGAMIKDPITGTVPVTLVTRAYRSALALVGIFLPGLLLMVALLRVWSRMRRNSRFRAALWLVNASVVGILLAALIRPVTTTAIHSWMDGAIAIGALLALTRLKAPPWSIVLAVVLLCSAPAVWAAL